MSTIVTRAGKGSALTYAEVDSNFTNLNNDKYQSGDSATLSSLSLSTALPVASGGTGTTTSTGSGAVVLASSPALVTPDLGTPSAGNFSAGTFTWPTFNQDTTGSAAALKSPVTTGLVTIAGVGAGITRQKSVRNANDTLLELGGSYTPTGTWNWTSVTATWPTFNQNTTGSAGSVANAVTFNNSGTGAASGTTYNGSAAQTISYNTIGAQPAGTYVTSVTGTAPVVSSGGTTPEISMAAATGSVNGYLSSTDWNTFNNKQAALVSGTNIKTVSGTSLLGAGDLGTIGAIYGGTGQSTYTLGDTLYSSASNTLAKLSGNITTTRQFLRQTGTGTVSAAPAWDTVTKTDVGLSNVENTALSTWAGSANITTLGTVATGTWQGGIIGATYGGTGQTTYTDGQLLIGNTTGNTLTKATLTAGTGISITNGAGSITIEASSGSQVFNTNTKTTAASASITSTQNAFSVGPITVATGHTVTVASTSRWVIY